MPLLFVIVCAAPNVTNEDGVGERNPAGLLGSPRERVSKVSFADTLRQSRVPFANDPRSSIKSRHTRVFHEGRIPFLPHAMVASDSESGDDTSSEDNTLSPTQTQVSPLTLTC